MARLILKDIKSRNCLFGTVSEKVLSFVIDASGSMDQVVTFPNGAKGSRMDYVKVQLAKTIGEQLQDYQKFNVFIFASSIRSWQSQYVLATPENIKSALAYVNSISTFGSTNISGALQTAFNTKEALEAIVFLTDGVPSDNITDANGISNFLKSLNAEKVKANLPSVKIYANVFC